MIADIWRPGHMATPQGREVVVPGQGMGWGPCPLPPYLLSLAREMGAPRMRAHGLLGWTGGADPRDRGLWGQEPGAPGPRRGACPPPAWLGHAWHAERGPVGSVCAPRAPIGMREPARRGREAAALAGGAGEAAAAAAGHVFAPSFAWSRAG